MRIAVTTIVRGAPVEEPGGWLRVIDLDERRELTRAPAPDALHRAADPNPRGGVRGARGVAAFGDRLALAVNDRVIVLDRDWAVERVVSHRWLGGVHDIAPDADGLWVACSDNDLVVRLDWSGRVRAHWHWRADRRTRRVLGMPALPAFERWADHRDPFGVPLRLDAGHVNAVVPDGDRLLVGLGLLLPQEPQRWPGWRERGLRLARRAGLGGAADAALGAWRSSRLARIGPYAAPRAETGHWSQRTPGTDWSCAVFELELDGKRRPGAPRLVGRQASGQRPAHHALPYGDLVVVALSGAGRVIGLDRQTGAVRREVAIPGELPFPRGLLRLPGGRLLVGVQSPAALLTIDLEAGRIDDRFDLPDDYGESPYGIAVVPGAFADPAGRLPATRAGWPVTAADASAGG